MTQERSRNRPGRPSIEGLTDKQRHTLREVQDFVAKNKLPPTLQELADLLDISPVSVHEQVAQLIRKGYLERDPKKARGLRIVREFEPSPSELVSVPIVGVVAGGTPILAEENVLGEVLVEKSTVRGGPHFALRVTGESMTGAGILEGGLVIVRQQVLAENGDIVVALIHGEATVKRLYMNGPHIELRPENRRFRPIAVEPEADLRIVGKVVGILRPGG